MQSTVFLSGAGVWININTPVDAFATEGMIVQPLWTPLVADGVAFGTQPRPTDLPAADLYTGDLAKYLGGIGVPDMRVMNIPRHGNRPRPVPRNWPASAPLPGAVNVAFYDGHAEAVKLDRLWQLYWSAKWVPPAKRPGLP